ncbi:hypothetical protein A3C09_00215 [Candidatus Uhrbacteria bacterium RIFCSPHIGHO2_02_FULL_47_44]|uniref:Uncharacterized protein n=1 Tax=Candidatus Uhrbacteria bacterium RIFCSPLOWO2_02_FULL_48_18 TaxID=1802408 RepID=A0A1F7VC21_9BACT|nr:MAG: hypothetical protein A2839_03100 [Candidatus Uhrbacteria bacterium RIFCSPHIGHO2_01_FULL_47_10]OGL70120.1 MAG: hypothetical protein A3C09_00215 [Candidatus Uhrbacteria bacterium RIFCSPHIGHO2_02_FULL_47_44]OGL76775.1 MAG: hypothetical protein A3E97_03760 [Candidatus Uhrbacteria bacterium RIFCSPHIGHO2_12_FULL_47_12]OGL82359.1 MAG: hypothetical protein A3B20_01235 [Candidatus Uhrbacteria bacterium RIFCSPLOWO2_01_FULL_47_17]OGL88005.1 MAG: hypothetical protein A3I41_02765 [Candidatus Uhrbact
MSLRLYLIIMALVSLSAWIAWFIVIYTIDPTKSGFLGFFLFFVTLGISVLASVTLLGTLLRVWIKKDQVVYRHVIRSLRQGLILTALFLAALLLSGIGLLVWWVLVLIVFIASILELIFLGSTEST